MYIVVECIHSWIEFECLPRRSSSMKSLKVKVLHISHCVHEYIRNSTETMKYAYNSLTLFYLDQYLVLELVWAGQEVRLFISLCLKQHVSKDLLHDFSHAVLLRDTAVVFYGQDHRIPGGRERETDRGVNVEIKELREEGSL